MGYTSNLFKWMDLMPIAPRLEEKEMLKAFKPIQDFVVVQKWKPSKTTENGIIVLEDRRDYQSKRGTVVKIGDCSNLTALKIPAPSINLGDEVLFSAFAGNEIPMPEGYLIMRSTDILAVLEQDE
jgi:co-chaperonin GroES (HSP10)